MYSEFLSLRSQPSDVPKNVHLCGLYIASLFGLDPRLSGFAFRSWEHPRIYLQRYILRYMKRFYLSTLYTMMSKNAFPHVLPTDRDSLMTRYSISRKEEKKKKKGKRPLDFKFLHQRKNVHPETHPLGNPSTVRASDRTEKKRPIAGYPPSRVCIYHNGGEDRPSTRVFQGRIVRRSYNRSRFLVWCSLRSAGAGTHDTRAYRAHIRMSIRNKVRSLEAPA